MSKKSSLRIWVLSIEFDYGFDKFEQKRALKPTEETVTTAPAYPALTADTIPAVRKKIVQMMYSSNSYILDD